MSIKEELEKDAKIISDELKGKDNYLTLSIILAGVATLIVLAVLLIQYFTVNNTLQKALDYLNLQFKTSQNTTKQSIGPTPTPVPLPRGEREFGVSGGNNPYITNLKFSEYYPKIGEKQTITVSVQDEKGGNVLGVEIKLQTDNKTKTYPLTLTEGTQRKGNWSTTITAEDTYNYVYKLDIKAKNDRGQEAIVFPTFK